jgi:hypothetical protein
VWEPIHLISYSEAYRNHSDSDAVEDVVHYARSGYRKLTRYPPLLALGNKQTASVGNVRELVHHPGVQCYEDARTSHPCERGAGLLR